MQHLSFSTGNAVALINVNRKLVPICYASDVKSTDLWTKTCLPSLHCQMALTEKKITILACWLCKPKPCSQGTTEGQGYWPWASSVELNFTKLTPVRAEHFKHWRKGTIQHMLMFQQCTYYFGVV